jgi:hypothetical protein
MSYSKYLRDNLLHSYSTYDLDEDEDVTSNSKASEAHRRVHDPHMEISDEDEFDVGVTKNDWCAQRKYEHATEEEFKVNRGSWRDNVDDNLLRNIFGDTYDDDDEYEEDDDE